MTRQDAERHAARLNREHPDRAMHRWLARQDGDEWQVARVELPAGVRLDPLREGTEARPRPPQAPDPRLSEPGGPWGPP
jgi:hypothetical protein